MRAATRNKMSLTTMLMGRNATGEIPASALTAALAEPARVGALAFLGVFFGSIAYYMTRQRERAPAYKELPEGYKAGNEEEARAIALFDAEQELSGLRWALRNVRWVMASYIVGMHVLGLLALPALFECKTQTLAGMLVFYVLGGLGITAGAHRLWSHKSYKAAGAYRWGVMVLNAIANQGTVLHWSRDHRVHHKYSETRADPHNALRGFFFAHVGWLLFKKDPRVKFAGQHVPMEDLLALPEVRFQKRWDPVFNLACCFLLPALCGLVWGESLYNGFMVMGVIKYVVTLHATWLVNSAAHLHGEHPYDEHINPAESPVVSLFAVGEGWHNFHHSFPGDYSTSEFGASTQFNPTRVLIDLCAALGLVWDRNTASNLWSMRMKARGITGVELAGAPLFRHRVVDAKQH